MPLFGKKRDSKLIVNYMKIIEQSLIPMINEKLDLSINNYPTYENNIVLHMKIRQIIF